MHWYDRARDACKQHSKESVSYRLDSTQLPELRYVRIAGQWYDLVTGEPIELSEAYLLEFMREKRVS